MKTTLAKNNKQSQAKPSLRGEAPQEHGRKAKNPKTVQARHELIQASQKAKQLRKTMMDNADTAEAKFTASQLNINDVLIMTYQKQSGANEFKTFQDWKKSGFKVKKGEQAFRVWGKPKHIKSEVETDSGEKLESNAWEFWPMCCLFNEFQVEPSTGSDDDRTASKIDKHTDTESKDSTTVIDLGNQEALSCGLIPQSENSFLALTYSESKTFKTRAGAANWLAKRGYNEQGEEIKARIAPVDSFMDSAFINTEHVDQLEQRKERLAFRATQAQLQSDAAFQKSKNMADVIPFGQPILVGHHSERRDRKYRQKIWDTMGQSVALDRKAKQLAQRSESVGTGGVSTNDPTALQQLNAKLTDLESAQTTMKSVNRILRSKNLTAEAKKSEIIEAGLLTERQTEEIMQPDCFGGIGFASCTLNNNRAEIRRVQQRIAEIEKLRNSTPLTHENDQFKMFVEEGRICIQFFDGKPSDDVRNHIKKTAFRWSRTRQLWVRKATANALADAQRLIKNIITSS